MTIARILLPLSLVLGGSAVAGAAAAQVPAAQAPATAASRPQSPTDMSPPGNASLDAMRWHRRVLLIAAREENDPKLALQRRLLAGWQRGAADRDLAIVTVVGSHVEGASDHAMELRRRFELPVGFAVLLIGKDGNVAMRSAQPVAGDRLGSTIDAMPMRRAGER